MGGERLKIRQTVGYKLTVLVVLVCICAASTLICVSMGSVSYPVGEVFRSFLIRNPMHG